MPTPTFLLSVSLWETLTLKCIFINECKCFILTVLVCVQEINIVENSLEWYTKV